MHAVLAAVIVAALFAGACGGSAPAASAPASAPPADAAASEAPVKLDLQAIFPPGEGRELVLNNCQTCHNFAPIVILQMDKEQWARNSVDHRERVKGLSDADYRVIYEYVSANFNPDRPVPKLPKEILESWTSY